jgi:hypothetical protein
VTGSRLSTVLAVILLLSIGALVWGLGVGCDPAIPHEGVVVEKHATFARLGSGRPDAWRLCFRQGCFQVPKDVFDQVEVGEYYRRPGL